MNYLLAFISIATICGLLGEAGRQILRRHSDPPENYAENLHSEEDVRP